MSAASQDIFQKMRPAESYEEVLRSREADGIQFYKSFHPQFIEIACPACGHEGTFIFTKYGFQHKKCGHCHTLYCTPRPDEKLLERYYNEYESPKAWTRLLLKTELDGKILQYEPRVSQCITFLKSQGVKPGGTAVDVGAGSGAFAISLKKTGFFLDVLAIDFSEDCVQACREQGLTVKCGSIAMLENASVDLICINDLVEHLFDPSSFLRSCRRILRPHGFVSFATPNGEGFDFLIMKDQTRNITPPEYLSYFNPTSIRILLGCNGFEAKLVETPGKLDWEIIKQEFTKGFPLQEKNECLVSLYQLKSETIASDFQNFLVKNRLSSHMFVLAQKVEEV